MTKPCAFYPKGGPPVVRSDVWTPEHDGLPTVRYKYRPLTITDISTFDDTLARAGNGKKVSLVARQLLSKHLVEWGLARPDGEPVDFRDVDELDCVDHNVLVGIAARIRESRSVEEAEAKNSDGPSASS